MSLIVILFIVTVGCLIGAIYANGKTAILMFAVFIVALVIVGQKVLVMTGYSMIAGAHNDVNVVINSDSVLQQIATFTDNLLYELKIRLGVWW